MDPSRCRSRLRRAAGTATAGAVTGVALLLVAGPASADVTSLGGGAFGVSATALAPEPTGQVVIQPTPAVSLPGAGGGPVTRTTPTASAPGLISTGLLMASTAGDNTVSHRRTAQSVTTVNDLRLGGRTLTATAVSSRCAANGDGTAAGTTLAGTTGLVGVPSRPAPNTVVQVPGLGSVTLNEQILSSRAGSSAQILVNAIHVRLNRATSAGTTSGDIIIGQSRCAAYGPDVLTTPGGPRPTMPGAGPLPGLPRTGAELWQPTLAGGGPLAVGLVLLQRSRRRRYPGARSLSG